MRKTREILRLKFETELSQRAIARAVGVSNATVWDVLRRLEAAGLAWPLPELPQMIGTRSAKKQVACRKKECRSRRGSCYYGEPEARTLSLPSR